MEATIDGDLDLDGQDTPSQEQDGQAEWLEAYETLAAEDRQALSKYKSVEDALKGGISAQRMVGKSLRVPDEKASDDEKLRFEAAVRKYRAVPDKSEGYEVKRTELPEGLKWDEKDGLAWDAELEGQAKVIAHEEGMSPKALQRLVDLVTTRNANAYLGVMAADKSEAEKSAKTLGGMWKGDAKANLELCSRLASHPDFGGEEFAKFLDETRLGNNPLLAQFMHKCATALVGEGVVLDGMPSEKAAVGVFDYPNSPDLRG